MTQRVRLWQSRINTDVEIVGEGPPLVYLHGPWGLSADLAYVHALAGSHTVYAPRYPGTTPGDPDAIHQLDSLLDLVAYHAELLDLLELRSAIVVGHSVGGMLACELGAAMPDRVERLVLIDALGLWRDDQPVRNWMIMSEAALRAALFANPTGVAANAFFAQPEQPEPRADRIWALACTAKFIWPIPDKGLRRRIHRVSAPTLLIWGRQDRIVPSVYAEEFAHRIAGAQTALIEGAGHLPHLEQTAGVLDSLNTFLVSTLPV
jgi:pimeloyl-ACP methyl ester carboxylesterase